MNCLRTSGLLLLTYFVGTPLLAQPPSKQERGKTEEWTAIAVEIPMRDGVKLHTIIAAPRLAHLPLPIMMQRTPYGTPDGAIGTLQSDAASELSTLGYIQIIQDIRGRHKSEGQFIMLRPPNPIEEINGIDECTDTYDTIEWLIHNVSGNNGRVGMRGGSYDGWLAAMALIHPHPALKAVSPMAPVADMFLGDDFHHNGAFRLSYAFEYVWMMESGKDQNMKFPIDLPDAYEWYLNLGPLSTVNAKYLHGTRPSWNDFVAHPNYDAFWKRQAITTYLNERLTVPTLLVGGWYDQEDFYGPQRIYDQLSRHDPDHLAYLVLGPWHHGGWEGPGRKLGPIDFGSQTGEYYQEKIQWPWFAHWLKTTDTKTFPNFAHVWTFETGNNHWNTGDNWPPRNSKKRDLYLGENRTASFDLPSKTAYSEYDSYISDPAHPAPYRHSPILPVESPESTWREWLTDDQRFLENRPDVLTWKTATLTEDITIAGDVVADIFASTSGTDSDWVVKLLDVYPETYPIDPKLAGYELIISNEVFRGRFRKNFEHPKALTSGRVEEYRIDLHTANHTFLKGHRIGIHIQSAWFPLIDRNPQSFVPNIFEAKAEDYKSAVQKIYRSRRHATHIILPVKRQP